MTTRHHTDSPTHIDTVIQNTNLTILLAVVETEQGEASESPKELDKGPHRVDIDQVMEYQLDNRKEERRVEEEGEE